MAYRDVAVLVEIEQKIADVVPLGRPRRHVTYVTQAVEARFEIQPRLPIRDRPAGERPSFDVIGQEVLRLDSGRLDREQIGARDEGFAGKAGHRTAATVRNRRVELIADLSGCDFTQSRTVTEDFVPEPSGSGPAAGRDRTTSRSGSRRHRSASRSWTRRMATAGATDLPGRWRHVERSADRSHPRPASSADRPRSRMAAFPARKQRETKRLAARGRQQRSIDADSARLPI